MKLNRFIQLSLNCGRKRSREVIASGGVRLDGVVERDGHAVVTSFTTVVADGTTLQERERIRIILHKPAGYVSATKDAEKKTVMEFIPEHWREELHIAGRLDKETTGLLILTNDSEWSESLTKPGACGKVYRVKLERAVPEETADHFKQGIYLAYEDVMTSPAELEILESDEVRLTLYEGKYHQVKRMFLAVGNRVVALHREQVGDIILPVDLKLGEWRAL